MLRSPSVVSQYNDDLSSPDPLAASFNEEHTTGSIAHGSRKPAVRRSSIATSNNMAKHTKSSSQSIEIFPPSPFRAVSEQNLSPWKIRVTVEAEPEDIDMDGDAPMPRASTRTTTIPVQTAMSLTSNTKSSTRGGKARTGSGDNKRSGTPVRGDRKSSRTRRQSVTDLNIIPLGEDGEEDDWLKQKRSPQKRRSPQKLSAAASATKGKSSSPSKSRPRSNNADVQIRLDTGAESEEQAGEPGPEQENDSPELKKLDMNQISVRPRAPSTKDKPNVDWSTQGSIVNARTRISTHQAQLQARKVSANSAMSYPTPSPTSSYHGESDEIEKPLDDDSVENQASEGFDTIHESEGFTMIDLETLPSIKRYLSSPVDDGIAHRLGLAQTDSLIDLGPLTGEAKEKARMIEALSSLPQRVVAYPSLRVDDSELSSTVPSSPPAPEKNASLLKVSSSSRPGLARKVTPQPYSSPHLPSPPRHQLRRTPQHQHRASAGTLFAGIALQEIVSPAPSSEKEISREELSTPGPPSPRNGDALFSGYGSGTQRELRAGLRFGEELGKRQVSGYPAPPVASRNKEHTTSELDTASSRTTIQPQNSDTDTQTVQEPQARIIRSYSPQSRNYAKVMDQAPQTPQNKDSERQQQSLLDTQAKREHEWQLEREAISRQIQNASESQVIVIDSDSEDEQEAGHRSGSEGQVGDETDIWLAEANSSSSPHEADPNKLFTQTEQHKQRERAKDVICRPRRSLIPSPWKRGEHFEAPHEQSTFLSTNMDEMSGLMAYNDPTDKVKFGAGQIKRQQLRQRRNSGKFDIDLMAGTPKKWALEEESTETSNTSAANDYEGPEECLNDSDMPPDNEESSVSTDHDEQSVDDESRNGTSDFSEAPSPVSQPVKIPVKFNDSSMPISTPPPPSRPSHPHRYFPGRESSDSPPRPPTPRSAMKGARENLHPGTAFERPDTPTMVRRVIFSGRSRGVDVDGQESSFSMRSSSDGSFGDEVGMQLKQELRAVEIPPVQVNAVQPDVKRRSENIQATASEGMGPPNEPPAATATAVKGWTDWIWGSKQPSNEDSQNRARSDPSSGRAPPKSTMASYPSHNTQQSQPPPDCQDWQKTKSSIPSSSGKASLPNPANGPQPVELPSYLLPPSYPSDPLRSTTTPLSLSGEFSNTHFRTLHIIYRKSLRPKFHPPGRDQIRREVWDLRGKEVVVDESENGGGEFVWTVGDGEVEVLERFMQEVEVSNGWFGGRKVTAEGVRRQGKDETECTWGWSVEELAGWLCRIVVGEVVREDERKAREREREMAAAMAK